MLAFLWEGMFLSWLESRYLHTVTFKNRHNPSICSRRGEPALPLDVSEKICPTGSQTYFYRASGKYICGTPSCFIKSGSSVSGN